MAFQKPRWLGTALAVFTVVLFCVDAGSNGFVGHDLYTRCHYKYAASVLSFVALPGFLLGGYGATMLCCFVNYDFGSEKMVKKMPAL